MSVKNAQLNWQVLTPLNNQFNDPYFSLVDGIAETEYVFLEHNRLPESWINKQEFIIAETGFGTGLNFLITATRWIETASENSHLTYYSIEKYPLSLNDLSKVFGNWPQFNSITHNILENYPDGLPGFYVIEFINEKITLVLMIGDVLPMLNNMQCSVDSWYLDGFAPAKNPEMWSIEVCQSIADLSHKGTSFATFTAAGVVRRNLQSVGFDVQKSSGFGKKREMLSGVFSKTKASMIHRLPWFETNKKAASEIDEVFIIGGGLAGLSCAWMFSQRNIKCTIIEAGNSLASGASGNAAGIVMPRFSLDMNLESQYYISSFLYAVSCLNSLKRENDELLWHQSGVLELASEQRLDKVALLDLPENFIQCLTPQEMSDSAGTNLSSGGFLYPEAGYVDPYQLCTLLAKQCSHNLSIRKNRSLAKIKRQSNHWELIDGENELIAEAKTLIFANGFDAQKVLQLKKMNLSKSRGQLSYIPTQDLIKNLKLPVCSDGYIIPQNKGFHAVGATYDMNSEDKELSLQDHLKNLRGAEELFDGHLRVDSEEIMGRVSFRTTSVDHLPLVGPVPDETAYLVDYKDIRHGRKADLYPQASYLPDVYLSTGHGSRGLVSCFSSAAYLTSLICGKPITWAENISHLLHPARFLIRDLKRNIDE